MAPDPIELTRQLIAMNSISPDLDPGAPGETVIADWCAAWLADHGFDVERVEDTPGRPSIIATFRGTGGGRSLLLNGHLDTVGVDTYDGDPFGGEVHRGDVHGGEVHRGDVHGRGAFDMKGGVAAIMAGAARAVTEPLRGDVILTLVADEEFNSIGTEQVLARVTADAAIVTEPTNLALVLAHRGFAWFTLEIEGRAAHGSMPHEGVDAIAHAGAVMRALDDLRGKFEAKPPHPLLGHSAVRVSEIHGGVDAATVAPSCTLTIERRMLPGESPDAVEAELRATLDALAASTDHFRYTLTRLVGRGAFEADPDWPIVTTLAAHADRVLGRAPDRRGEPYWTDAGLIHAAGIPCVLMGVDGGGAHADTEWATAESIEQLTAILHATIRDFCA